MSLSAPFPYFGGKSSVAARVWHALGQPDHYIEPFFGSGAVLLARPGWHAGLTETVNDANGHIANVWRAIAAAPDEVARFCDWPVNHADLMARKAALHAAEGDLLAALTSDPDYYDARLAGFWVWCASAGIGAWYNDLKQRPHLDNKGVGVHKLSWRGQLPTAFAQLAARLRYVRVVCGDWSRVCGGDWQTGEWPTVGIFFDPPYAVADRDASVYGAHDSTTVAAGVRAWCIERGERPDHSIVLAGYEEHAELVEQHGWTAETWSTGGGYGNVGDGQGAANRHRETLYFSPHCQRTHEQGRLL